MDPSGTDTCAHRSNPPSQVGLPDSSTTIESNREHRSQDDLLKDPALDVAIDFTSQAGQREHAKKKKKAAATPVGWGNNNNDEKKDDTAGDGNGGDQNSGGDNGTGAGPGGNGNGNNGGDNPDDDWANFTTATSKKKKGKAAGDLPEIPTSDFGADAFHEIKLGDDPANKLDLGLGGTDNKNSLGSWGNKWNTGGSTWDWSGGGDAGDAAGADDGANPWSKPKKKDKTTFSFGAFDEAEEQKDGDAKDDGWGFASAGKKKKNGSLWDPEPESKSGGDAWGLNKKKDEPADDDWFTPGKKDKKKTEEKDDLWDTWGGSKKTTMKKSLLDDFGTPDPTPAAPDAPPADDAWASITSKGKKKKKGGLYDDGPDAPAAPDPPAATAMNDDFGWGLSTGKKKKNSIFAADEPKEEEKKDDGWGLWGAKKKDTKKKNSLFDDPAPEESKKDDDIWDTWGGSKKDKKAVDDLIQLDDGPATNGGGGDDDFFSSWGAGKKDKKKDTFSWADDNDDTWDLGTKKDSST